MHFNPVTQVWENEAKDEEKSFMAGFSSSSEDSLSVNSSPAKAISTCTSSPGKDHKTSASLLRPSRVDLRQIRESESVHRNLRIENFVHGIDVDLLHKYVLEKLVVNANRIAG